VPSYASVPYKAQTLLKFYNIYVLSLTSVFLHSDDHLDYNALLYLVEPTSLFGGGGHFHYAYIMSMQPLFTEEDKFKRFICL
jgi:hypothetical protein